MPTIANSNVATKRELASEVGVTYVSHYAISPGSSADTDGVKAAITACGANGTLVFEPGATYLLDASVTPLAGQTWIGYGSILKRMDEVTTTTDTDVPVGGQNTFTVADASGFRVGQSVNLWDNGDIQAGVGHFGQAGNVLITDITDDVITVASNIVMKLANGTAEEVTTNGLTLFSSHGMINDVTGLDDIAIFGLEIDGNLTNNATFGGRWEIHKEIQLSGDRNLIENVYLHDSIGEGVYYTGISGLIRGNKFEDINGNGIHLSGTDGLIITENSFYSTNLLGEAVGHQDGNISCSNAVDNTIISNNISDGESNSISFVGGIDAEVDTMTITGNVVSNMDVSASARAIAAYGLFEADILNLVITGNYFENCTAFELNDTGNTYDFVGLQISNNTIIDTEMKLQDIDGAAITGNTYIDNTLGATGIQLTTADNIGVKNNTIIGGAWGITVNSGTNIDIVGNTITNATARAISIVGGTRVAAINNSIASVAASAADNWVGIRTQVVGVRIKGNNIWTDDTGGTAIGISTSSGADDNVMQFNTISVPATELAINIVAGADRNIVTNNTITVAVADAGTDTVARDNDINTSI